MNGDSPTPKPKRRWLWIVLGVLFVMFCVAIGSVFFAVSYFRENVQVTENVTENSAVDEFEAVLAKFPGQQPLIQMVDDRPQLMPERVAKGNSNTSLTTLHVLAFDRADGEMVRLSLPFWLLRMQSGPIRLSAYQQGWDDRDVSFEIKDIEKAGPGIVMDVRERNEGRLLIWAN